MEEVERYDACGRLHYHPDYHENHCKPITEEDLEYLCKYYETDGLKSISMALGRTQKSVATLVMSLRKNGKFDYYKKLNKHW